MNQTFSSVPKNVVWNYFFMGFFYTVISVAIESAVFTVNRIFFMCICVITCFGCIRIQFFPHKLPHVISSVTRRKIDSYSILASMAGFCMMISVFIWIWNQNGLTSFSSPNHGISLKNLCDSDWKFQTFSLRFYIFKCIKKQQFFVCSSICFSETYQHAPGIRATHRNVIKISHISTGCSHGYIVKIIGLVLFVYLNVVDILNIPRDFG